MFTDDFFPLLGMYIDSRFLLGQIPALQPNNAKPISAFFMIKNKIINYTIFAFSFSFGQIYILHQPDSDKIVFLEIKKSKK